MLPVLFPSLSPLLVVVAVLPQDGEGGVAPRAAPAAEEPESPRHSCSSSSKGRCLTEGGNGGRCGRLCASATVAVTSVSSDDPPPPLEGPPQLARPPPPP